MAIPVKETIMGIEVIRRKGTTAPAGRLSLFQQILQPFISQPDSEKKENHQGKPNRKQEVFHTKSDLGQS